MQLDLLVPRPKDWLEARSGFAVNSGNSDFLSPIAQKGTQVQHAASRSRDCFSLATINLRPFTADTSLKDSPNSILR